MSDSFFPSPRSVFIPAPLDALGICGPWHHGTLVVSRFRAAVCTVFFQRHILLLVAHCGMISVWLPPLVVSVRADHRIHVSGCSVSCMCLYDWRICFCTIFSIVSQPAQFLPGASSTCRRLHFHLDASPVSYCQFLLSVLERRFLL